MTDIMLDIETLGTDSNALVLSISAVKFNLKNGNIGDTFEIGLYLKDQGNAVMDTDTIIWWLDQSKEAQDQLKQLPKERTLDALTQFSIWIGDNCKSYKLWGNGATFDNVIVRNLYARVGVPFPIPFWNDRCVRTYVDIKGINARSFQFTGIQHKGLDDCFHQIKYMTTKKDK